MWKFLTGKDMQRIVIFSGLGSILSTAGIHYTDFRLWAIIIFAWLLEFIAFSDGVLQGTDNLLNMEKSNLIELKDLIDSVKNGGEHDEEELDNILKKEEENDRK